MDYPKMKLAWPRRSVRRVLIRAAPLVAICAMTLAIYLKMFLYSGYISWGNFGTPINLTFDHSFLPNAVTWSPFSSYGAPVISPGIGLLDDVYDPALLVLGGGVDPNFAMKVLIFLSTAFLGGSFYRMTGEFTRSLPARVAATLFILGNPLAVQFVMMGLFQSLIWQGFYFLSLSFLPKSLSAQGRQRLKFCFLSALCLSLTAGSPPLLYLGLPLYLLFVVYFGLVVPGNFSLRSTLNSAKVALTTVALLLLFLSPLLLTTFYSAYNVGPTSSYAKPLSDYILYSTSVWNMLSMNANPAYPLAQIVPNQALALIWEIASDALSLVLLASGLLVRQSKLLFLSLVIMAAAILGAGSISPFASLNIYFYENFFGYQLLNDGYFWEWIVIVPLYGLILSVVADRILNDIVTGFEAKGPVYSPVFSSPRGARFDTHVRQGVAIATCLSLLVLVVMPVATSAFYSPNGIHAVDLPSSYAELDQELKELVGASYLGVAIFPPDPGVLFDNSSGGSVDPLLLDPYVRSPTPISYGNLATPTGYYATWVYNSFYSNATKDIAQLFGVLGVKYFVTLNNVNSKDSTYTALMLQQHNMSLIYASPDYSIFESSLPVNVGMNVPGLTIVSGSYDALRIGALAGLDLSRQALVFTSDFNSQNFDDLLNRTSAIVLSDPSEIASLAVYSLVNASDSINLVDRISNYAYAITEGWVQSSAMYQFPQEIPFESVTTSVPFTFALTESQTPITTSFSLSTPGNYTLWVDAMESPVPGSYLNVTVGNTTLNSVTAGNDSTGFKWIDVPFHSSTRTVTIQLTPHGFNGVGRLVILNDGLEESRARYLLTYAAEHSLKVLYYSEQNQSNDFDNQLASINNLTMTSTPLQITNDPNYFEVDGVAGTLSFVRLNYYSGMVSSDTGIDEIPVLGGMSFVLIGGSGSESVRFVSVEYAPLVAGALLWLSALSACLILCWFPWISKRARSSSDEVAETDSRHSLESDNRRGPLLKIRGKK